MTTEFRRAEASVEDLERLVSELAVPESGEGFLFYPRSRTEAPVVEDEWVITGSHTAAEVRLSPQQRAKFAEVESLLADLEPVVSRLRQRSQARADVDAAKDALQQFLESCGSSSPSKEALQDGKELYAHAQRVVEAQGPHHEDVRTMLGKALELERYVTYGSKMSEQVLDVIARHDAAVALCNTEIVPRLGAAMAAAAAHDDAMSVIAERKRAAALEEEARKMQSEQWRPVAALLAASAQRAQQLQAEKEERDNVMADWHYAQSLDERVCACPPECSQEAASTILPSVMWMYS